jgi:hypothetical protein
MSRLIAIIVLCLLVACAPSLDEPASPTAAPVQRYHADCLEEGHQQTVVTANPCLQYPYVLLDYGYVQVVPEAFIQRFYANALGKAGGNVKYDAGYSLDTGYWSGAWSLSTQPFTAKAEQCYLMISDFFADVNNGKRDANKDVNLANNASLNMYLYVGGERISIGNHPTVKEDKKDAWGNQLYELKGLRRGMSAFWFADDTQVSAEFEFVVNWGMNIHETRLTFHDAYVTIVGAGLCNLL